MLHLKEKKLWKKNTQYYSTQWHQYSETARPNNHKELSVNVWTAQKTMTLNYSYRFLNRQQSTKYQHVINYYFSINVFADFSSPCFRWSIEQLNSIFKYPKTKQMKKERTKSGEKKTFAFDFKVERSALWLTIILILRCTKICYFVLLFSPNWPPINEQPFIQ